MKEFKNKLRWVKYRIRDFIWNNRGLLVPGGTGLASIIWFIIEPSPEPIVLLSTTFLAAFVWNREKTDVWYTTTQGIRYEIFFRADGTTHKERLALVNEFIDKFEFIYKWAFLSLDGDSINTITIDTLDDDHKKIIKQAYEMFALYSVTKNGHQIHERGIG